MHYIFEFRAFFDAQTRFWRGFRKNESPLTVQDRLKLMDNLEPRGIVQPLGPITSKVLPGFPIRTEAELGLTGGTIITVTSIKKEPIDDSVFAVPADYRQVQQGQLTGQE